MRRRVMVTGGLCAALLGAAPASAGPALPGRAATRAAALPCAAHVDRGVLPPWARTGFSEAQPRIAHVVSRHREMAAILFGDPLRSPPARDRANKILWVSRRPVGLNADLRITAQRVRGTRRVGRAVHRTVSGGPGPSIIDLPGTGCWRVALRWSGRSDSLDLRYTRGR